jgi:uncharacterized membrane protein YczE
VNIWQVGFVVRSGVSALVVAFLLGYAAHHEWGLSRAEIRNGALVTAVLIGALLAIGSFGGGSRKRK